MRKEEEGERRERLCCVTFHSVTHNSKSTAVLELNAGAICAQPRGRERERDQVKFFKKKPNEPKVRRMRKRRKRRRGKKEEKTDKSLRGWLNYSSDPNLLDFGFQRKTCWEDIRVEGRERKKLEEKHGRVILPGQEEMEKKDEKMKEERDGEERRERETRQEMSL